MTMDLVFQRFCPALTSSRDERMKIRFMLLVTSQLIIGVTIFVLGVSTITYTPSYPVGSFWAGFIVSYKSSSLAVLIVIYGSRFGQLFVSGCSRLLEIYKNIQWDEKRQSRHCNVTLASSTLCRLSHPTNHLFPPDPCHLIPPNHRYLCRCHCHCCGCCWGIRFANYRLLSLLLHLLFSHCQLQHHQLPKPHCSHQHLLLLLPLWSKDSWRLS